MVIVKVSMRASASGSAAGGCVSVRMSVCWWSTYGVGRGRETGVAVGTSAIGVRRAHALIHRSSMLRASSSLATRSTALSIPAWVSRPLHSSSTFSTFSTCSTSSSPPEPPRLPLAAPYRIAFFGSDDVSVASFRHLLDAIRAASPHSSSLSSSTSSSLASPMHSPSIEVICTADQPAGRGRQLQPRPLKRAAVAENVIVHEIPPSVDFRMSGWEMPHATTNDAATSSPSHGFDVGVVVSFGYFLPDSIIHSFPHGMINLHPSLLPRYRGASPIQHALWNDDDRTGVSIIDVHPSVMDAGDILYQVEEPILRTDTYDTLQKRLAALGARSLLHVLNQLSALRAQAASQAKQQQQQQQHRASASSGPEQVPPPLAPKITAAQGEILWDRPARDILLQFRALHGFHPLYTFFRGKRTIILDIALDVDDSGQTADSRGNAARLAGTGSLAFDASRQALRVECANGSHVFVRQLIVAGKAPVSAASFANGYFSPESVKKRKTKTSLSSEASAAAASSGPSDRFRFTSAAVATAAAASGE